MYDKKEPIRATHRYIYPCDAPKENMVDFHGFCYNQNSEILENLPFSIWRKIKTAQKSRKGTKAAEAVEKPGKLKAGARQDSKSRNEQDSKNRKSSQKLQDSKGQNRDAKYLWKV